MAASPDLVGELIEQVVRGGGHGQEVSGPGAERLLAAGGLRAWLRHE